MQKAGPGDVFTSSFVFGVTYNNQIHHTPFDWPQQSYDAIRNAVLKGIAVTCAAGNTHSDLGDKNIYGTRYLPTSTPSGAVICGATFGPEEKAIDWSNYGSVVGANAWGVLVTTTAYGQLWNGNHGKQSYTHIFGGTSAAAPQVAGVLASIQSVSRLHRNKVLSPKQLIDAVTHAGVVVAGNVGVRPNLLATLEHLHLWRGLRVINEGRPGKSVDIELRLPAGRVYTLLAANNLSRLNVGLGMPLLLDPNQMIVVQTGIAQDSNSRGKAIENIVIGVPNDPWFSGKRFYFQTAHAAYPTGLDLTNVAVAWLR